MNDISPQPPADFTNPYESKIIDLEKEYSQGMAEGKVFATLKEIRRQIRILKSELSLMRVSISSEDKDANMGKHKNNS